ncbi:hypothetical protein A9Q77_11250 [Marinomonas sp. 42_23_T18]|nr:hypothetical protein A9Q77_11250 [Marinomonas sp. 42_23_T18]
MVYFVSSNLNPEETNMSLENAPKHIQLAVDLIEILESNNVDDKTAVAALELVLNDFRDKLKGNKES